jgi:membrane glycosyltransferase
VPEISVKDLSLTDRPDKEIVGRRALFATLAGLTIAALLALTAHALSAGGFGVADAVLLLLFGLTLPWSVIGFWNASIGFLIMRFARDPVATVLPAAAPSTPASRPEISGTSASASAAGTNSPSPSTPTAS